MNDVDDTLLMSYVDGELDVATSREVEAVLRMQPRLARKAQRMREDSTLLRAAFNHALHDVPREAPRKVPALRSGYRPMRPGNWRIPLAMAASALLLVGGVLLGRGLDSPRSAAVAVADAVTESGERDATLQAVLEAQKSGGSMQWASATGGSRGHITAVSTYRTSNGRFCREFEESRNAGAAAVREAGVACRDDNGQWRVRIRYYP